MAKSTGRDYPLSPTPTPTTDSSSNYMSRKDYKNLKRQAKFEHNIEAAREGKLSQERINKVKGIADAVGSVVNTAVNVKNLTSKGRSGGREEY